MKLIEPSFKILEQAPGMDGMLKHIELCGRTCYKSHDKITEGSAEKFVERMKSLGHGSVLEHTTVYLTIPTESIFQTTCIILNRYFVNKYSKISIINEEKKGVVTTNYRVLLQGDYETWDEAVKNGFDNNWLDDLKYMCEPTEHHERRVTVRFSTDIGISREFNRHRVNSISEESTRYCNYSKGKFGGEISVVPPIRVRGKECEDMRYVEMNDDIISMCCRSISNKEAVGWDELETWTFAILSAEWSYMRLTQKFGWTAQEARSILPLCTATELVHTAFVSDWENFFKLRCDSHAHPMARELAIPLREEFLKRGLIKE